jgi:hypothetical protein
MSEKKFYVYLHRYASGPKCGEVFYVGKGKDCRWNSERGRNKWWRRISDKYGFLPEIVMRFENETCAFSLEKAIIALYGRSTLCNLSDGGEGPSGLRHTDEWKRKMSEFMRKRPVKYETIEKMRLIRKENPTNNFLVNHVGKVVTNSNGETFNSISEAARIMAERKNLSVRPANILRCLKGLSKTAYGVSWSCGYCTPELPVTNRRRPVKNIETGEVFNGVRAAAESMLTKNGKPKSSSPISKSLRGDTEKAYGFTWAYVDEL